MVVIHLSIRAAVEEVPVVAAPVEGEAAAVTDGATPAAGEAKEEKK
jgi:hypothetical protein